MSHRLQKLKIFDNSYAGFIDAKAIYFIVAPESKIMIENFINEALEK